MDSKHITCFVCQYEFRTNLKRFGFIHHVKKHQGTKPFTKKAICEACISGLWNDDL
jgi:hypothetical protein